MLIRLSRWSYRYRLAVVGLWIGVVVGVSALNGLVGSGFSDALEVPDSETKDGFDALEEHFDGAGSGLSGQIVFRSDDGVTDPEVQAAMEEVFARVDEFEGVSVISPYSPIGASQIAAEGELASRVAFAEVQLDQSVDESRAAEIGAEIRDMKPAVEGLTVFVGGQSLEGFEPPESELIGIGFAIVILIVSFGSVLAMGLPIGVAVVGVGTGIGLTSLLSNVQSMPEFATTIGAMIGLGVGIDYALFIVTRYREALHSGRSGEQALLVAMDTAGRAVLFAGITVVVSLLGLLLIGLSFVTGLGVAASITVLCTMVASLTLLPALIGLAGPRVERTRRRGLVASGLVAVALVGSASASRNSRSRWSWPWSSSWSAPSCPRSGASCRPGPRSRSDRPGATASAASSSTGRGRRPRPPVACSWCWPCRSPGCGWVSPTRATSTSPPTLARPTTSWRRPSGRASTAP